MPAISAMHQAEQDAQDAQAVGNDEMLQVNEEDADEDGREEAEEDGIIPLPARLPGVPGDDGEQHAGQQFDAGVAPGDRALAVAALRAQQPETRRTGNRSKAPRRCSHRGQ